MTLYITPDNKLHDDANGAALLLPSWPQDAREATPEEIEAILNPAPQPETPEQIVERLKAELRAIEQAEIMPRQTRELNIKLAEFLASQEGSSLEEDIVYQKLVEIDTKCKKIREKINEYQALLL